MLKKYSNRRIYDDELARYVTIPEITERVIAGEPVPSYPGGDSTAEVLLTIIGQAHPTADELRKAIHVIRAARSTKAQGGHP